MKNPQKVMYFAFLAEDLYEYIYTCMIYKYFVYLKISKYIATFPKFVTFLLFMPELHKIGLIYRSQNGTFFLSNFHAKYTKIVFNRTLAPMCFFTSIKQSPFISLHVAGVVLKPLFYKKSVTKYNALKLLIF